MISPIDNWHAQCIVPPVMRPMRVLALAGLSTTLLGTAVADIESSFTAGYSSDYIFRGGDVGNNLFDATLDFSGSGAAGALGDLEWNAGFWLGTFSVSGPGSNNELDLYGSVTKSLNEMFSVTAGITNFTYFGNGGAAEDDIEPWVGIGADVYGISLSAAAHYDGANNYAHELYWEFKASYEQELCAGVTGRLTGLLGLFDDGADGDEDLYLQGIAAIDYAVSENITVTGHATVSFSDDLGDHFFGGGSVSFGF